MTLTEAIENVKRRDPWSSIYEDANEVILNAVVSGDLIPKAALVEAEARGMERAAEIADPWSIEAAGLISAEAAALRKKGGA